MSNHTRVLVTFLVGGLLWGLGSGCNDNAGKVSTTTESDPAAGTSAEDRAPAAPAEPAEPAEPTRQPGQDAKNTATAETDAPAAPPKPATPPRPVTPPPPASAEDPMIIFADCHAPHRWTWGWTLNVAANGAANVDLKPDAYGEDVFDEFKIKPEQMAKIRKALDKADFFELQKHYGDEEGPVKRTLRIKIGNREHETSFTARHTQLDGVPVPLLELWCLIRETFNTYRAHDGAEYIRQYLEGRASEGDK